MISETSMVFVGLSNESKVIIDAYINWAKLRHDKFVRDVEFEAKSYQSGNLLQQSYNKSDVENVLAGQFSVLCHSLEKQHQFVTASSAELCRAILQEADRNRIPLQGINALACLQNATAVTAMEAHEQRLIGGPKGKLAPLTAIETGGDAGRQLAEANEVIRSLNEKLRRVTDQYTSVMQERTRYNSDVLNLQDSLQNTQLQADHQSGVLSAALTEDQRSIANLRSELAHARNQLELKVNATPQFVQLRKMVADKNAQVKALVARVQYYEPSFTMGGDDVAIGDE